MKKYEVTVVIPIYKTCLSEYEQISLRQVLQVLGHHRIVAVKPRSLDISSLHLPAEESFDDDYFAGIAGYNRLMMSAEFYRRFSDSEYILIYQLDAYVFSDRLKEWCGKGYDYVGAPWLSKPIYRFPLYRLCSWMKRKWLARKGLPHRSITRDKVGNGGLSLRRVDAHIAVLEKYSDVAAAYLSHRHHLFNEDVFFSVEVRRREPSFRYPTVQEALDFAFDKYPRLCFRRNHHRLPFGCHAWYKRKMRRFWFPIILGPTVK